MPSILATATPFLALVALSAIAWARLQDRQVRKRAAGLQRRLEGELEALRTKGQRIRLRIVLIVELYAGGSREKEQELAKGCDELLARLEVLRGALFVQSGRLQHLRRRELREAQGRIAGMAAEGRELARTLEEQDKYWSRQLGGMTSARTGTTRSLSSTKPALT